MAKRAVICDIDGTIADLSHRLAYIKKTPPDWGAFFAQVKADSPILPIIDMIDVLGMDYKILLVSGRPERTRLDTKEWLVEHGVVYDELYMRPDDDRRADTIVKSQILDGIIKDGYEVKFVIDDRPSVVAMWRDRGLVCLQCNDWKEHELNGVKKGHLTIMVGPSGAGKTTWLLNNHPVGQESEIISSDDIRRTLCGDFKDQTKNDQVFAALHTIVRARIENGLNTTIDATNIRRKDRLACVALADGGEVTYVVVDRPIASKYEYGGWRTKVGFDLIAKHDQIFRSNLIDILAGDNQPNVKVNDTRKMEIHHHD